MKDQQYKSLIQVKRTFISAMSIDELKQYHAACVKWKTMASDQGPIREDLLAIGYDVIQIFELKEIYKTYDSAIPILVQHLSGEYSDLTLDYMARLLETKSALPYWNILYERYMNSDPQISPRFMDGLSVALSGLAMMTKSETIRSQIHALMKDKSRGQTRIMFLRCITRKKDSESLALMEELRHDPEFSKELKFRKKFEGDR